MYTVRMGGRRFLLRRGGLLRLLLIVTGTAALLWLGVGRLLHADSAAMPPTAGSAGSSPPSAAPSPSAAAAQSSPTPTADGIKAASRTLTPEEIRRDGTLVLVNGVSFWPDDYEPELVTIADRRPPNLVGLKSVDMRAQPEACDALMTMLKAARDDGVTGFVVVSAYRGYEKQQSLFDERVRELMNQGLSRGEAESRAGDTVALPGCSEHHTGLAFDLVAQNSDGTLEAFVQSPQYDWMRRNCARYGFILRYPEEKKDITGISCEPWHYRYVGVQHALEMERLGFTLEEYVEYLASQDPS